MFNPLGIENLKVSEQSTQIPAFMRKSSNSILNFDDILNARLNPVPESNYQNYAVEKPSTYDEINNVRKGNNNTIENQPNSSVKNKEPENLTHEKTKETRENEVIESAPVREKSIVSNNEKDEKNNKVDQKDEEQSIAENIKLLNTEIKNLLDLMKGLHGKDKKLEINIKDLGASLKELRELLKTGVKDNVDSKLKFKQIFAKLEHIFRKLENTTGKSIPFFKDNDSLIEFAKLKDHFSELLDTIKKQINKGSNRENPLLSDEKTAQKANSISNDRIFVNESLKNNTNNESEQKFSSKNDDSNFDFQFMKKNNTAFNRNALSRDIQKNADLNSKQFKNILEQAKITVKNRSNGSFTVRMHPKSLGSINVNLNLEDGVLVGRFLVSSNEARDALLDNVYMVKEKLEESGITVGDFHVNVREEKDRSDSDHAEAGPFNDLDYETQASDLYEVNDSYIHDGAVNMII